VANIPTTPASAQHVSVDGTRLVYLTDDGILHVVDVTQPVVPVPHGSASVGTQQSLLLRGTLVHLAGGPYQIYSAADLDNLVPVSIVYGNFSKVLVVGTIAALTDASSSLFSTYDINDPASPQIRDELNWGSVGYGAATGIDVDAKYAYITVDNNGRTSTDPQATGNTSLVVLRDTIVIDTQGIAPTVQITNPGNNASVVRGLPVTLTAAASDDVAVASVRLLVNGEEVDRFQTAPFETTWYAPDPGTYSIYAVATDFGGQSTQSATVTVTVIADPLTTVTGTIRTQSGALVPGARVEVDGRFTDSAADGTYTVDSVPTNNGAFTVHACARLSNGLVNRAGGPADPVIGGTTRVDVVVAATTIGPIAASFLNTAQQVRQIAAARSTVYLAGGISGLGVVDLRVPDYPVELGRVDFVDDAEAVTLSGTQLFVAAGEAGVHLADITNPLAPARVSTLDTPSFANDLAIGSNGVLFIADSEAGLQIADFSNPLAPAIVSNVSFAGGATAVAYAPGGYAIVGSAPVDRGSGGADQVVSIVDVHTPTAPLVVGTLTLGRSTGSAQGATRIVVRGTLAYVGSRSGPLFVVDFSSPVAPRILKSDFDFTVPGDLAIGGNALVVAGGVSADDVLTVADIANGVPSIIRWIGFPTLFNQADGVLALDGELAVAVLDSSRYLVVAKYREVDGSLGAVTWKPSTSATLAPPSGDRRPGSPPQPAALGVDRSLVSIVRHAGTVDLRGNHGAVVGAYPLSVEIRNVTLGTAVPVVAVAEDGSFESTVAAAAGDRLSLTALSGAGERVELDLGPVPNGEPQAGQGPPVPPAANGAAAPRSASRRPASTVSAPPQTIPTPTARAVVTAPPPAPRPVTAPPVTTAPPPVTPAPATPPSLPPAHPALRVQRSLVSVSARGGATFVVHGATGAVLGAPPLSVEIKNVTLGTSVPVVAVDEDGAFETTIVAAAGDRLSMKAVSGVGEQIEIGLGQVPENEPQDSLLQEHSVPVDRLHLISNLLATQAAASALRRCDHCAFTQQPDQSQHPVVLQGDGVDAALPRRKRRATFKRPTLKRLRIVISGGA